MVSKHHVHTGNETLVEAISWRFQQLWPFTQKSKPRRSTNCKSYRQIFCDTAHEDVVDIILIHGKLALSHVYIKLRVHRRVTLYIFRKERLEFLMKGYLLPLNGYSFPKGDMSTF